MLAKIGILFAIPFVLLGAVLVTTDTVVVDVREDGNHFVVPVPLPVARLALGFVPEDETTITCPELWKYRDAIDRVVEELGRAPDGELVRVEEPGTFVVITKRGKHLHVEVEDGESVVDVKVPLSAAHKFLDRLDGETFNAKDLLASVNHTMNGNVVHVQDGDCEVKISVW